MTDSRNREFLAVSTIILAVCVGAWFMFVQPNARELARLQTEIAQAGAQSQQLSEQTIESFARQVSGTREFAQKIVAQNRAADDSSQLYAIIMELARNSSVEVQSLNPGAVPAVSTDGMVSVTPIEVSVVGEYAKVAQFLDALVTSHAFIRANSLTVAPIVTGTQQLVSARFTCQALHFNLPEALLVAGGSPDVSQPKR